ncbi:MAG: hypothetical protein ABI850_03110 [Flavobacterium sp.]
METKQNDAATDFLESIAKMRYFTKLKTNKKNKNVLNSRLKISNYQELIQTVSSLLRTSINTLQNDSSDTAADVMLLLEIALQLLPEDEMELLDELHKIDLGNH